MSSIMYMIFISCAFFFFQAEDGIRDWSVTGVQTCALPIYWFTEWIARPPAAVVVYALRKTPITPNQVTFLSAVIAAGACAMFALLPGYGWLGAAPAGVRLSFLARCAPRQPPPRPHARPPPR